VSQLLTVSGTDLRYLLTAYLFDDGHATVEELVDALAYHGFRPPGRPSKAFRTHCVGRRRARTRDPDQPRELPPWNDVRATRHRIIARVRTLHDDVAALSRRRDAGLTA
jgi:hypothetical protein